MTFWKWSRTASSNATADSTCPFPEGMMPGAVNDGVRGLMAAAAKYRDDVSGALATTGTSTAYAVSSYQGFDSLAHLNGAMIAFVPHATSGAAPTLSVDGLTAKKIRTSTGVDMPEAVLVQGTPYAATYFNTVGEFIIHGLAAQPYSTALGGLMIATEETPPNSAFVLPYGQAISRTVYATYFSKVGTKYGSGDGSTTFNVLDLRGRGIVCWDKMGGTAAGRITTDGSGIDGTTIGATGGEETHELTEAQLASHAHGAGTFVSAAHSHKYNNRPSFAQADGSGGVLNLWQGDNTNANTGSSGPHTVSGTSDTAGSGAAHNNMPPSIVLPVFLRII